MTDAAIIGGGIAGTTTAMALLRAGFSATVYEARETGGADAGAFLTVGTNGMRALAQIDATGPVMAAGFPLSTMELTAGSGQRLALTPLTGATESPHGPHHLRRAALYRALQDTARGRGVRIEHGKRLAAARTKDTGDTGVHLEFTDGTSVTAGLLIGADGLRSTVRTTIDPDAAPPRYAGQWVCYGYTAEADPPSLERTIHMVRGARASFGYTVSPAGETWWFARVPGDELSRQQLNTSGPADWRRLLIDLFREDSTPAAGIVEATGNELIADNIYDLPGVRTWHRDSMIVVGDAAHAASPAAGQGASMALEDAIILAKSLRDLPDFPAAFAAYEQLRRARVDRVITGSARLTERRMPGPLRRAIRNYRARREYAKRARRPQSWLSDYPLDWDIPITPEHAARVAADQRTGR